MGMKVGIIAGQGDLPSRIALSAARSGHDVFVVRIKGLADEDALSDVPGVTLSLGKIGGVIEALHAYGCKSLLFAGYITRPDFASITFDAEGHALLPKITAAAEQGDDAAIGVFVNAFQDAGFRIVGPEEVYPELLCPQGDLTHKVPDQTDLSDLSKACRIAGIIGREDIGQGCVVRDGVVVAVEAQEGTDAMLQRAGELDLNYRPGQSGLGGVLVKRAKPGQEKRVDLPVIGVRTVELAAQAGLAGIGLEAGASLIIDRAAVIDAANRLGLFLTGMQLDLDV